MNRVLFTLLLIIMTLGNSSARNAGQTVFGGSKRGYCIPQVDVAVPKINDISIHGSTSWWHHSNNVKVRLCHANWQTGCSWYRPKINVKNGFRTVFKMGMRSWTCHTSSTRYCKRRIWRWCVSHGTRYNTERCGADGAAFVMQNHGHTCGSAGGNLGYAGMYNVAAVEFDTWQNGNLGDPWWSKKDDRHMSLILKTGRADAHERGAYAWNDRPLNWANNFGGGWRSEPTIDIRYFDRVFEVYVDGAFQFGHYNLDIPGFYRTDTMWIGFTAATGGLKEEHWFWDWQIHQARPYNSNSYSEVTSASNVMPNQDITFRIQLRDSCGRFHNYNSNYDSANHLGWNMASNVCSIQQKWLSGNLYVRARCTRTGKHNVRFSYRGQWLKNTNAINVQVGPVNKLQLSFAGTARKRIDEGAIVFNVKPLDKYNNIANTDVNDLKRRVKVTWPNAGDSNTNYPVVRNSDGTWRFEITSTKPGVYSITSSNLPAKYTFEFLVGLVSDKTSTVTLIPTNGTKNAKVAQAGASYKLEIVPKDIGHNLVTNINLNAMKIQSFCNGKHDGHISGVKKVSNSLVAETQLKKSGNHNFKPMYGSTKLKCTNCDVQVQPSTPDFNGAKVYQYNYANKKFELVTKEIKLAKNTNGKVRLVLTDSFGNAISSLKAEDVEMKFEGNAMTPLNLCLQKVGDVNIEGTICDKDTAYFNRMAGVAGYTLTITYNKQPKKLALSLESDGSDRDCGNDRLELRRTTTQWIRHPPSGRWGYAGETYTLQLMLRTLSLKRYCAWDVDTKDIKHRLIRGHTAGEFKDVISDAKKYSVQGVYAVDITFYKASRVYRYIYFFLKGMNIQPRFFVVKQANAHMGYVSQTSIQQDTLMKDGVVNEEYNFKVFVFDKYKNPSKLNNANLVLSAIHQKHKSINLNPGCKFLELGIYYCTMKAKKWGVYDVTNQMFNNFDVKGYQVGFYRTEPSFKVSTARIVNDLTKPILAGTEVTYRIVPKDEAGDPFIKKETLKIFKNFAASFKGPDGKVSLYEINENHVDEQGNIILQSKHTVVGRYKYTATYDGNAVICEVCSMLVSPNEADLSKTRFYMVSSSDKSLKKPIYPDQTVKLDNTVAVPIFIAEFYDAYNNVKEVVSGYSTSIAELNVPKGAQEKYPFRSWNNLGKIQFEVAKRNHDFYKSELANEKCTLLFRMKKDTDTKFTDILFKSVILIGKKGDDQFSNDPIDLSKVLIDPSKITIKANEKTTLKVELRTSNGKLYNHPETLGWYKEVAKELLLGKDLLAQTEVSVVNGKLKGTYVFTFTSKKAIKTTNVPLEFYNPTNKKFETAKPQLSLTVKPADYNYLVMNRNTLSDCTAGDKKAVDSAPFDEFNNPIEDLEGDQSGLNAEHAGNKGKVGSVTTGKNKIGLEMKCEKAGQIVIAAPKFKEASKYNARVITNYKINVNPGTPSAPKSMAVVTKSQMNAGETVMLQVYPYDAFENKITIDAASKLYKTEEFTAKVVFKGEGKDLSGFKISDNKQFYYLETTLTVAGYHTFQAFYKGELVPAPSSKVMVKAIEASFADADLLKQNDEGKFEGPNERKFTQAASKQPTFQVTLFDKFKNPVDKLPSSWTLALKLTGEELKVGQQGILFCADNTGVQFKICDSGKHKVDYEDLITNRVYDLIFSNGKETQDPYKLDLVGEKTDPEVSNLPVDEKHTVIVPNSALRTVAGKTVTFVIEVRTTNGKLRRNDWYENPSKNFVLVFSKTEKSDRKLEYKITRGDAKGKYLVSVTSEIAFDEKDPNVITVKHNGVDATYKPKLIVSPDVPASVYSSDVNRKDTVMTSKNIDTPYIAFFSALDKYKNDVQLNTENTLNLEVKVAGEKLNYNKDYENGVLKVSFQPKTPGNCEFIFVTPNKNFNVELQQGTIYPPKSFFTVSKETGQSIVAGNVATIEFYPKDRWGNALVLDASKFLDVKNLQLKLLLKAPGASKFVPVDEQHDISTKKDFAVLTAKLTVKGVNNFAVEMQGETITGVIKTVNVKPAPFHFPNTKLEYFEDNDAQFVTAIKAKPMTEDNVKEVPVYRIRTFDTFKNELDDAPCDGDACDDFAILLTGHDYDKDKPVTFEFSKIAGNLISFTLKANDQKRFKNGLFKSTPYDLDVFYKKESLDYKVMLLGRGKEKDNGAEIEEPMDVKKTLLDPVKLEFVAGKNSQFTFVIKTKNNLRKSDATPKVTFAFSPNHDSYKATLSNSDLLGKYIVSVQGTKTTGKNPTELTVNIDGQEVPKKVKVTILPDEVKFVSIVSDTKSIGNADVPYEFSLKAFDQFKNQVFNYDESDVNLQIKFPKSDSVIKGKTYTTTSNTETGIIVYKVAANIAGVYVIKSDMLIGDAANTFTVKAGAPYYKTSTAVVAPVSAVVNSQVAVTIQPFDKHNNPIIKADQPDAFKQFTFAVSFGKQTPVVHKCKSGSANNIEGSFTNTVAGQYAVSPRLGQITIPCNGCNIEFVPGPIELPKTQFYLTQSDGKTQKVNKITIDSGSKDLKMKAMFYDKFNNRIKSFEKDEDFTFTLSGHSMVPIVFKVEEVTNLVSISVPDDKAFELSRLVPAKNYIATLVQLKGDKEVSKADLSMDINGEDTGAGNGPVVLENTVFKPETLVLTAGKSGSFTIELQQKDKKRFNGVCDKKFVSAEEATGSAGSEKLKITLTTGALNCQYKVDLLGFKALAEGEAKKVKILVNGVAVNKQVSVDVEPDVPDFTKTQVTKEIAKSMMTDVEQEFSYKLFDQYKNQLARSEYEKKLFLDDEAGNLKYVKTTLNGGVYTSYFLPLYPPAYLAVNLYFEKAKNNKVTIFTKPFATTVLTKLDPSKTDMDSVAVTVAEAFKTVIRLKDVKGYCFETAKKVTMNIDGPYTDEAAKNKDADFYKELKGLVAITVKPKLSKEVSRASYECHQYYEVSVPAGKLTGKGFYQASVFLDGENEGKALKSLVKIKLNPGSIVAENSVLAIAKKPAGIVVDNTAELGFVVGNPIVFSVTLRDKFKNEIGEDRDEKVTMDIDNMKDDDYESTESDKNGVHDISITFKKVGLVRSFVLNVNKEKVASQKLELNGFPRTMKLYPGKCSKKNPGIDYDMIKKAKPVVNEKFFFNINCYDKYGNQAMADDYKFGASFKAEKVGKVGNVEVDGRVSPQGKQSNKFSIGFKPSYAATYKVAVVLDGKAYGEEFDIKVTAGVCPAETPTYCVNSKKCVSGGYKACGFPELKCDGADKPIKCKVFGDDACVRHSVECDCEDMNKVKCMTDNKCVPFDQEPALCSTFFFKECGKGETQCTDGISCRKDITMCPAPIGCPPGHELCPDQSCVIKGLKCPSFEACPPEKWNKCEDQTCQANPTDCPTRISCPVPNSVICPDKSCAPTELECPLPAKCEGMYRCPDLSCRPSQNDCPVGVSCPNNLALCPDGVCRESCKGTSNWRRLLAAAEATKTDKKTETIAENGCKKGEAKCPGGECVSNVALCPTVETCPVGAVKCADGSCEASIGDCRSSTCKKNEVHCWDGSCASGLEECPTRPSCPEELSVKCPNGACVASISDCQEVISCPKSASYRCGSGECRRKAEDCPTFVTCPVEKPVACVDGSCSKTVEGCLAATKAFVCSEDQVLCPGGYCAQSRDTCPTLETCPVGFVRCWDNDCAESPDKCDKPDLDTSLCSASQPVRCFDGTCVDKLKNCPTQVICPQHLPIKCSDGNCRQSVKECSKNSECPLGSKRCPDGSCTQSQCGTSITCPEDTPIKCYDNTCRIDRRDCPPMPTCPSERPVLCEEGHCVFERADCKKSKLCPNKKPIKCPDLSCAKSVSDCEASTQCPTGYVRCADSSCRAHNADCEDVKCPFGLFLCKNGLCVRGKEMCDKENGCPFNKPNKCEDGSCTKDLKKCPAKPKCGKGQTVCADGSCGDSNIPCPGQNGCMPDLPFKCANGKCINPQTQKCQALICPSDRPSKCLDGTCVSSFRNCPGLLSFERLNQCKEEAKDGNLIPCADGTCVSSPELCRPLLSCPEGYERCANGECRPDKSLCPAALSTCPKDKPTVCSNGACAKSDSDCVGANGCPLNKPEKCKYSGLCLENKDKCDEFDKKKPLKNGCTMKKSYKCEDNTCVKKKKHCKRAKKSCAKETPFKCMDGTCEATKKACQQKKYQCKKGQTRCPDNKCVDKALDCKTTKGCPITKPFKCEEGCSNKRCKPSVKCPPQSPHKCLDGTCVGSSLFCNVVETCPGNKVRCPDGKCKENLGDCSDIEICPVNVFVRCLDGRCVSSPEECNRVKSLKCQDDKPIRCLNGQCASKFADCLVIDEAAKEETKEKNRKLAETATKIDEGCNEASPVRCSNGGCVSSAALCEVLSGCGLSKPYRCQTGACAADKAACAVLEKGLKACGTGLTRCTDGICRATCIPHSGCPLNKPLTCTNNNCGADAAECQSSYKCDVKNAFRCFDGTCKGTASDCVMIMNLAVAEKVQITTSAYKVTEFDFIQNGKSSVKLGSVKIPAAALNLPVGSKKPASFEDELKDKILTISAFPDSTIRTSVVFKATNNDKLKKALKNSDGNLKFHEAVRSPVIQLDAKDRDDSIDYRYALSLTLATQKYDGTENFDYCLAILQNSVFTCVSSATAAQDIGDITKLTFSAKKDGIYAVVFNPLDKNPQAASSTATTTLATTTNNDCGYWCQNKGLGVFLILLGIILITLLIISLVVNGMLKKRYTSAVEELNGYKSGGIESGNVKGDSESSAYAKQLADKDAQIDRMRQRENVLEQEVNELRERINQVMQEQEAAE